MKEIVIENYISSMWDTENDVLIVLHKGYLREDKGYGRIVKYIELWDGKFSGKEENGNLILGVHDRTVIVNPIFSESRL